MQTCLIHITKNVRAFLEPRWPAWHENRGHVVPKIPSTNTCGRSSLFLLLVLGDLGFASQWASGIPRREHGTELGPHGFFSSIRWESHSWVECESWIIDVTADQFGGPRWIVTDVQDPRYGRGSEDTASDEAKALRLRDVEAIWPDWLESFQRQRIYRCCSAGQLSLRQRL
jgi:hypothetical protein